LDQWTTYRLHFQELDGISGWRNRSRGFHERVSGELHALMQNEIFWREPGGALEARLKGATERPVITAAAATSARLAR